MVAAVDEKTAQPIASDRALVLQSRTVVGKIQQVFGASRDLLQRIAFPER
jgi:hypothetical protein